MHAPNPLTKQPTAFLKRRTENVFTEPIHTFTEQSPSGIQLAAFPESELSSRPPDLTRFFSSCIQLRMYVLKTFSQALIRTYQKYWKICISKGSENFTSLTTDNSCRNSCPLLQLTLLLYLNHQLTKTMCQRHSQLTQTIQSPSHHPQVLACKIPLASRDT